MKIYSFALLIFLGLIFSCPQMLLSQAQSRLEISTQPREIGDQVVANIVDRYYGWRYQKACSYYGALIFADATGNREITSQIENGKEEAMNVCIGTNAKDSKKHYLTRPKTNGNFHGQAAILWAMTILVRSQS